MFRNGDKREEALERWEARWSDEDFIVDTWMANFRPAVHDRKEMVVIACSVLRWLPELRDVRIKKIQWKDEREAQLVAQIKEFVLK